MTQLDSLTEWVTDLTSNFRFLWRRLNWLPYCSSRKVREKTVVGLLNKDQLNKTIEQVWLNNGPIEQKLIDQTIIELRCNWTNDKLNLSQLNKYIWTFGSHILDCIVDLLGVSGSPWAPSRRPRAPLPRGAKRPILYSWYSVFSEQREWRADDTFHPFSSDKIRAKILDLGYGGARRALYNLSPKSARIL